jgi:putative ABC transport system permease protein
LFHHRDFRGAGDINSYLVRVVLQQAVFYGFVGYLPAWAISVALYRLVAAVSLLPMHMTFGLTAVSLALTVGMCVISGLMALRGVVRADPAEVF